MRRFLALSEEAARRQARRQLRAIEAACAPWMKDGDRQKMQSQLLEAASTPEQKEARWDAAWRRLDELVGGARIGGTVKRSET